MTPRSKAGWLKAAFILLATLPLIAAAGIDPRVLALDPPEVLWSHRYWASSDPSENAPSKRLLQSTTYLANYTKLLVTGGLDDNQAFDTMHVYDIASGSWEKLNLTMGDTLDSHRMQTFQTENGTDLVTIFGSTYLDMSASLLLFDVATQTISNPEIEGWELLPPVMYLGGSVAWKDLFILYGGLVGPDNDMQWASNDTYVLNVTSWTWSLPTMTGAILPTSEAVSMAVVPDWNGRDTMFIFSNSNTGVFKGTDACPVLQSHCVFSVDLQTWNVTRHITHQPGPAAQFGSSTSLLSTDPLGNRYIYHYGGGAVLKSGVRRFSSDLNVLQFEPEVDWVSIPVRDNPQIQKSWMGCLIGGLPQNMPAWMGEEPLLHMQGGQVGQPYVSKETRLTLGGSSPTESIINPPTVYGSLVENVFQVYAGEIIQFTLDPRNALGVPLPYGGDQVYAYLSRSDGVERSCATDEIFTSESIQYIISCQVLLYGNYTFKFQIRDADPIVPKYQMIVQPANVSVAHSVAEGNGMQKANAGEVASYNTILFDAYGNRASVVSEHILIAASIGCYGNNASLPEAELLDASSFEQVDSTITLADPVSSLYKIEYIPKTKGVCKVQNMVNNSPLGNVTYVAVSDPLPLAGFIALGSAEGVTFMVLNILSCLASCVATYFFGIKSKEGYRDAFIFGSGALALFASVLYIGEPRDASCKARSAIAMMAFGMFLGVLASQTLWFLGYYRTPNLARQLPISQNRVLKYACAAVCSEGLLIIILQMTAPMRQFIFTVKGETWVGCDDATGNKILYAHLALLFVICLISILTTQHEAPDLATSSNSIIGYNLALFGLFLIGLIGILENEDVQIFFVLQSLDIWIACMLTFGLVIYSKVQKKTNSKLAKNMHAGNEQVQTLAIETAFDVDHSKNISSINISSQKMVLAQPHLCQDSLTQATWKKCVYFHPAQMAYGVIYYDFSKPGICLETVDDVTTFENDKSGLKYGLRLKVHGEEKVLAFATANDRSEYLEALKKIRGRKGPANV